MQDFVAKFVPHLAHVDHAFASGLRAGVVAALLLGVLPVMLPLGVLGPWIAAPVLVGLTASRVGIAVAAQLTAARWGIASDHETNAASRASWVDVGFVLSVGAVVDGLWTHNLGPAALLCMFAAVLFAVTPRGRRALGMANDSYIKSKESVVIGKTTFVAFLQTTVTIGDLIEDLRTELRDFPWQERLDPKHKADYAHAGMPSDMIAKIYDITGDDEIRQLERLLTAARA